MGASSRPSSRHWFSNFLPFDEPLVVEGTSYATPEHWYQAMKTADLNRQVLIATAPTAAEAKSLGNDKAKTILRPGWTDALAIEVMRVAQEHRYRPGTVMREKLRASTEELVETNTWHDTRWGRCTCKTHKGQGENWLGQILMVLRDRIWKEDGLPEEEDDCLRDSTGRFREVSGDDDSEEDDEDEEALADLGLTGAEIIPFPVLARAVDLNVDGLVRAALVKVATNKAKVNRKLIGFDTETYLVQPGLAAPRMVCGQFCSEDGEADAFLRDDALTLLHHFLDNGYTLVGQNISYDVAVTCVADPTLIPKWIKAYDEDRVDDTMVREKMIALAKGQLADEGDTGAKRGAKYDLATIVRQRFCVDLSGDKAKTKTLPDGNVLVLGLKDGQEIPWRLRYRELDGVPVDQWPTKARDYALDDPKWVLAIWAHQQQECDEPIPDLYSQVRSACWLRFMGVWGIRTDPPAVFALQERVTSEYEHSNVLLRESGLLRPKIVKGVEKWSKDMTKLKILVVDAYGHGPAGEILAPKTEGAKKHRKKCADRTITEVGPGCTPTCKVGVPDISTDRDTLVNAPPHHLPECTQLTFVEGEAGKQTKVGGCRSGCPTGVLKSVGERSGIEKLLTTFIPVLLQGTQFPINPNWNELVASGRTSCVAKGTLIEVVRDVSAHPLGIPIEDVKVGDLVYAFDDTGAVVLRKVTWAGKTGTKRVVRLHWNGTGQQHAGHLDLTPDHQVRHVSGFWRSAGSYLPGDRVMAISRGVRKGAGAGYPYLYATGSKEIREHRFVFEQVFGWSPEHVHHKNDNKADNRPENLEGLSASEHLTLHGAEVPEELRRLRSTNQKRRWRLEHAALAAVCPRGEDNAAWRGFTKEQIELLLWEEQGSPVRVAERLKTSYVTLQKYMAMHNIDFLDIARQFNARGEQITKGFVDYWRVEIDKSNAKKVLPRIGLGYYRWREVQEEFGYIPYNHEVLYVEELPDPVDVYDLTVEDVHNYIANEICVHNCRGENLQQPPRKGGVRECFIPRQGNHFVSADYSFIELCTLAQACFDFFGFSKLREAINAGLDPHIDMAVFMLAAIDGVTLTYAEAKSRYKAGDRRLAEMRQWSKVANFGLPGGLGAETLVEYARTTFGVTITLEVAKTLKPLWLAKWPEMVQYLKRVSNMTRHGRSFTVQQLRSGRIRGECGYCDGANSYFQGMAADGAKEAGWRIFKETMLLDPFGDGSGPTALYGSHLVLFLHDEFIIESPIEKAPKAALRLSEVMIEGMKKFVPDVTIKAEAVITDRWIKGAEPRYGPDGLPTLYVPKSKR